MKALAFRVHWMGMRESARQSVVEVVAGRLRRTVDRFTALLARFEAGTLTAAKPRPARPRLEPAETESEPHPPRLERTKLPRHFGWLREMSGDYEITRMGHGVLPLVSDDAKMRALIEAAPRVGRLLRAILWMTGALWIPPILVPPDPDPVMKRWMAGNVAKQAPPPPPPPPPPFFASLMPTPQQEEEARRYANRPGIDLALGAWALETGMELRQDELRSLRYDNVTCDPCLFGRGCPGLASPQLPR